MKIYLELSKDANLVHGGKVLCGNLLVNLDRPKQIRELYVNFDSEIVTRARIRREDDDGHRAEHLETSTDCPFLSKFVIGDFTEKGELLSEGIHAFPFSLPLPNLLPGSIEGPSLGWTTRKLKYEVNYWLTPGLKTVKNKDYEGEKLPLRIQETPDLANFDPSFRLPGTQRFRKEFTGLFGRSKGTVHATIVLKKLHAQCGKDFDVPICFRNESEKEFPGFHLELVRHIQYDVDGFKKHSSEVVASQKVELPEGDEVVEGEKVVPATIRIPEDAPASTPGYYRKIGVEYTLWIKMLNKLVIHEDLEVLQQKILVSPLPWY